MSRGRNESDHLNWEIFVAHFWMREFVQPPVPLTLAADVINVTFSRSLWPEKLNAEHLKKKKKKAHWQSFLFTVGDSQSPCQYLGAQYLSDFAVTPEPNKLPKSYKLLISWMGSCSHSAGFTFPAHMLVSCMGNSCACKSALRRRSAGISGWASALWSMIYNLHSLLPLLWTEVKQPHYPPPSKPRPEPRWVLRHLRVIPGQPVTPVFKLWCDDNHRELNEMTVVARVGLDTGNHRGFEEERHWGNPMKT